MFAITMLALSTTHEKARKGGLSGNTHKHGLFILMIMKYCRVYIFFVNKFVRCSADLKMDTLTFKYRMLWVHAYNKLTN
jgi:hypothetical protein